MFYRDNRASAINAFLARQTPAFMQGWDDYQIFRGDDFQRALCDHVADHDLLSYNLGWETHKRLTTAGF